MKSILVFRSAALGDFVMAIPALNEVRRNYPDRRIILLTTQSAEKSQREKVAAYTGNSEATPWVNLAMPHLIDKSIILNDSTNLLNLINLRRSLSNFDVEAAIIMADPCAPWIGRVKKSCCLNFFLAMFLC